MSKRSKKKDYQPFNIILVIVILFILTPIIPFLFGLLLLMRFVNLKGKYGVIVSGIGLLIIGAFFNEILNDFLREFQISLSNFLNCILHGNFNYDFGFLTYKNTSWIIIFFVSIFLASYFKICIDKNKENERAGIKPLNDEVKNINNSNAYNSFRENPCKCNSYTDTFIGYNKSGKKICVPDNSKHIFISGTTGSGKTVALSNFIRSACIKNYGALIIDGKGDEGQESLLEITKLFCKTYNRKLYIVSMNDPEISNKYNPFIRANETVAKDMLINMTTWSEEHYKTNTERYLQRLIKLLKLANINLSFNSIVENIKSDKFIALSKNLADNKIISNDEHLSNLDIAKASSKIADNASARFLTISESKVGELFNERGVDIYKALKEKAIIIFVLNPLLYPETAQAMGRLILIDTKKAVSKLFNSENRKFFIFDEINVYASSVLVDLINKSRSANITCIPATQSLSDLENETGDKFKNQIIENCNNYIVLRQNSFKSAEEWAKTIGTKQTMLMTYQMNEEGSTKKGSSRRVREFIVHPDEIKSQGVGEAVYISRDRKQYDRIKVFKPF